MSNTQTTTLIACREWLGPSRDCPREAAITPIEMTVAFVTQLPLSEALAILSEYRQTYNIRFRAATALCLTPISVTSFPLDDMKLLTELQNTTSIEDLKGSIARLAEETRDLGKSD